MSHIEKSAEVSFDGLAWLTQPYRLLLDRSRELGDTFELDLGRHGTYVLFSNPSDVRTIFAAESTLLHAGQGNAVLKAFLGAGSLLLLEEQRHADERRLLQPAFHGRRLASHARTIVDVATSHVARLEVGGVVQMQQVLQSLTLDLIVGIVFGDLADTTRRELTTRLASFLDDPKFNLGLIGELDSAGGGASAWNDFRGALASIRATLSAELDRRRAAPRDSDDVLTMLLEARYPDGTAMSDVAIVDELLTMVVTGYETTATGLSWALYWTHRDPALRKELRDRARAMEPIDAQRDPWITSLIREVLRIHPVIPIVARRAESRMTIGNRTIERGTTVAPCIFLVHHRADLYPDPDTFRATRFMDRTYASHEYLPFGGGARRCIGMGLAWIEIAIVLAVFARSLDLDLLDANLIRPQRRSVTVAPSRGTPMRVVARHRGGGVP